MKCLWIACCLIFALAALTSHAAEAADSLAANKAKPAQPPKTFDLAGIDAYVAGQLGEKDYIGLSLAIFRDGKMVLTKAYGKSSLEPSLPAQANTPFAIGSITKQFVCACVLLLAEDGKLAVRDPVAKYYPSLTRAKDITLYDLMTHASGYPDYYPLDFVDRRMLQPTSWTRSSENTPRASLTSNRAAAGLTAIPVTRFLAALWRRSAASRSANSSKGESSGHSSWSIPGSFLGPRPAHLLAAMHPSLWVHPEVAAPEADGWVDAAGGIYSTASDLARWDMALIEGKVLKPESYRLMTMPRQLTNGKTVDYGCGLSILRRDGETILRHSGAVSGFLAFNAVLPCVKSGVALLCNSENPAAGSLHAMILGLLLKDVADREGPSVPRIQGPPPKDAALDFFHQLQAGSIKRDRLGEEFSYFLDDERVRSAATRLKALGEPEKVEVLGTSERGGMEVANIRLTFKTMTLGGSLYRSPDGKIQQLLFSKQ